MPATGGPIRISGDGAPRDGSLGVPYPCMQKVHGGAGDRRLGSGATGTTPPSPSTFDVITTRRWSEEFRKVYLRFLARDTPVDEFEESSPPEPPYLSVALR